MPSRSREDKIPVNLRLRTLPSHVEHGVPVIDEYHERYMNTVARVTGTCRGCCRQAPKMRGSPPVWCEQCWSIRSGPGGRRIHLYVEQGGVCVGCDIRFPFRVMEVDHKLPPSKGGTDHPENLQLLCSGCNRSKGSTPMAEWKARQ